LFLKEVTLEIPFGFIVGCSELAFRMLFWSRGVDLLLLVLEFLENTFIVGFEYIVIPQKIPKFITN
jgi:hypothetical protein